jgi:hypothetical protein
MTETGTVDRDDAILTDTVAWNFEVSDVCAQAGILASRVADGETNLFETSVWVGDDAEVFRFFNYEDTVATSDTTSGDCGEITVSLVDADQNPLTSEVITLAAADATQTFKNWQITMGSTDPADYTNTPVTYYLKVALTDYADDFPDTVVYEPFTVEVKNCMITDLEFDAITDKDYNIYTDTVEFSIPEFTQEVQSGYTRDGAETCDYDVEYEVKLADGSELPDFMHWNFIDRIFSYYTQDEADVGEYNVVVIATVSANHQDGGFTKTQEFKVTVANGCAEDFIAFSSFIPDYSYFLGVSTSEESDWAYAVG